MWRILKIGSFVFIVIAFLGVPVFFFVTTQFQKWSISDAASLGQLLVSWLLVVPAIAGVWIALNEIQKNNQFPKLGLYFCDDKQVLTKEAILPISRVNGRSGNYRFALLNTGSAIAIWYAVEIRLPDDLILSDSFHHQIGWSDVNSDLHYQIESRKILRFMSNGDLALYPNLPLLIDRSADVGVPPNASSKDSYEVIFTIYSDTVKPATGKLFINRKLVD